MNHGRRRCVNRAAAAIAGRRRAGTHLVQAVLLKDLEAKDVENADERLRRVRPAALVLVAQCAAHRSDPREERHVGTRW